MVIDKKISDESESGIDELIGQMIDDKMKIQYEELFEHMKNYLKEMLKNFERKLSKNDS